MVSRDRCLYPRPMMEAYTLTELLVVMSIIAILASLLMPTIGRIRESARTAVCASNLRQIGIAARAFANDTHRFPQGDPNGGTWLGCVGGNHARQLRDDYDLAFSIWRCPSHRTSTPMPYYTNDAGTMQLAEAATKALPYGGRLSTSYQWIAEFPGRPLAQRTSWEVVLGQNTYANYVLSGDIYGLLVGTSPAKLAGNHLSAGHVGANHLYQDGSVQWIGQSEFTSPPYFTNYYRWMLRFRR